MVSSLLRACRIQGQGARLEQAHPSTILVVDAEDDARTASQSALEAHGYRVVLALGGAQALDVFEAEHPDGVLLDARMPGMDGFSVCAHIRTSGNGPDTTIVFLTALRDVETFDRALGAGGDDFLTKPVPPAELRSRVQTALKLRQLRTELGGHYELLKCQLHAMLRLQLERERLIGFLVHDLKNPVAAIDLHAQFVLRGHELPTTVRESMLQVRAEARQLNGMILNLLDVSKAREGKLVVNRSKVDLVALVAAVVAEVEMRAQLGKVRIETSLNATTLQADGELLLRTLANLLENAIRHAPADTAVTVTTTPCPGGVDLRVADVGTGVPQEMRERIFDAFVQLSGEGRPCSAGGRGLGLTFCKLAVEAHGGRIWIEDAGPGAVFCVRVPSDGCVRRDPRAAASFATSSLH